MSNETILWRKIDKQLMFYLSENVSLFYFANNGLQLNLVNATLDFQGYFACGYMNNTQFTAISEYNVFVLCKYELSLCLLSKCYDINFMLYYFTFSRSNYLS